MLLRVFLRQVMNAKVSLTSDDFDAEEFEQNFNAKLEGLKAKLHKDEAHIQKLGGAPEASSPSSFVELAGRRAQLDPGPDNWVDPSVPEDRPAPRTCCTEAENEVKLARRKQHHKRKAARLHFRNTEYSVEEGVRE